MFWVKKARMFLDHLCETCTRKGQWPQAKRGKRAPQGRSTTPRRPLYKRSLHTREFHHILIPKVLGHLGKAGRNQTKSAKPRHTQGLNHFRTGSVPPSLTPRLRQGSSFISGGSWTRGREQDADGKGQKWVKWVELSSFSTPHAPFLSKQSLYCSPTVNVPLNV